VEIDIEAVRETGSRHFPDLAEEYATAAEAISEARNALSIDVLGGSAEALDRYLAEVGTYLDVSGGHLIDCGAILVSLVDDLDWTDQENAFNLENPSQGVDLPPNMS